MPNDEKENNSQKTQALSLHQVEFHGDSLLAVQNGDGDVCVPIKPICERLGLTWHGQFEKLQRDQTFSEGIRVMRIPSLNGGSQETTVLQLNLVPLWLATIQTSRIPDLRVRDAVVLYKRECAQVLYHHFFGQRHQEVILRQFTEVVSRFVDATNKRFDDLEQRIKAQPSATARAVSARETERITEDDCRAICDYIQTKILQTYPKHRVRSLRAKIYARLARKAGKDSYKNCPRYQVGDIWNEVREIEDLVHFAATSGAEQLDLFPAKKQRKAKQVTPAKVIEMKQQAAKNKAKKDKEQAS